MLCQKIYGKQIEIKPIIPTSNASLLTKTFSSDQVSGNFELCDDLRYDSEFLYENDRITQESLQKSSEPELIRRGTLTTQFLFGWGEKDKKDDRLESVQTGVEACGETSEITLNNDITYKNTDTNKIKDREIEKYETNSVQDHLTKIPIPCPTKSVRTDSSKNYFDESGFEDKCGETPGEIFISANSETEQGLESDYNIPLKKSHKLEPDVISPHSYDQETFFNDQSKENGETGNCFASDGVASSSVIYPVEFVKMPQELLIAPVMVSSVPKFQAGGPGEEHPPIVYQSLSDAIYDILGDVKSETDPHVLHEETRIANCDESTVIQTKKKPS